MTHPAHKPSRTAYWLRAALGLLAGLSVFGALAYAGHPSFEYVNMGSALGVVAISAHLAGRTA